jgi:MFS family permease
MTSNELFAIGFHHRTLRHRKTLPGGTGSSEYIRTVPVKRLILTLQFATAILASSYGVMFTMLDDYRNEYGIAESGLGFVVAVGFFASFISQVIIAPFADRGRAKQLLVLGFTLTVAGCLGMGFGSTLPVLLVSRIVMGIGAGMALPALRRIVIVADPGNLGTNMGRLLSVDVAGFAIGPMISALTVGPLGIEAPFLLIALAVVAVAIVLSRVQVPETAREDRPVERFAFDLLKIPPVAGAIMIGLALYLMIGTFDSLWAVMMDDFDAPTWMANAGVSLFVLPMIILGPLGGRLAQRVGPYKVGAVGMLFGAVFMSLYGILPGPSLMLGVFLLHTINDGLSVTSAGIAVGISAPAERQAGAQGLLGGLQTLMGGIAASLAGWTYDSHGRATAFFVTAIVMVALVVAGLVLAGPQRWTSGIPRLDEPRPASA